ncbi:MAG TPA: hypothetical protein VIJ28_00355, partial [Chloroflexota bacterium]
SAFARPRLLGSAFSLVAAAALLVLVLYPLITILIQSVVPGLFTAPARLNFSLAPFSRAFGNHEVYAAMFNTLWLGIAVAVIGALTGAVLAVLLVRTSLPGKALFDGLVWVTLFTPSYLVALAWELLFSRGGFIDTTIVPLPDGVVTTIFSPVGLTILLVLRLFPFSYLAAGALLSTWMLVFTGTIFELPASELLQPPGQPPLAVQITNQYNNFKQGRGTAMTILALLIVVVAALLIGSAARRLRLRGGRRAH